MSRVVAAPQLDVPAWRAKVAGYSRGSIPNLLSAVRDAVRRGELRADDPRVLALVERRFEDQRPPDDNELRFTHEQQWAIRATTDVALWPFLAEPSEPTVLAHLEAWANWNAVDDKGLRELGYALWALPNALHVTRMAVQASRRGREIVRRYAIDPDSYYSALSGADLLARDLERERSAQLGFWLDPERTRKGWELVPRDAPPYRSRRDVQARRRFLAERHGTLWPDGKGRRPGAEGKKAAARRADLLARFAELDSHERDRAIGLRSNAARRLVTEHAARHGVSLATAKRDWLAVRRTLHGHGQLGTFHLDAERRAKLDRRLGSL
jgi:HrpA-like RNA helicase